MHPEEHLLTDRIYFLLTSVRTSLAAWVSNGYLVKNIFVGNLDYNTGEDELRQLFSQYGQVDRVALMTDRDTGRSRGFGFVEMANAEEGEKAINELNGTELGGRKLNVNEARPKAERGGGRRGDFDRGGNRRGRGRW